MDEMRPNNGNGAKNIIEWFRLITPALVTINLFLLSIIVYQVRSVDDKMFIHLTNHEIHIPREQVVTQAEFEMHLRNVKVEKEAMIKYFDKMENNLKDAIYNNTNNAK